MLLTLQLNNLLESADTTAPVLSSPTAAQFNPTALSGTVTTDEGNGTLYYYASTNSSESAATIKASGDSQAVTATGSQDVQAGFLTTGETYYLHYVHDDSSSNESNVVSSAAVTLTEDAEEESNSGGYGFWGEVESAIEQSRRNQRKMARRRSRRLKKIEDELDRELFIAEQRLEEGENREQELARLTKLVQENRKAIVQTANQQLIQTMNEAINRQTFIAMERLERELRRYQEEQEFLMAATRIILEA